MESNICLNHSNSTVCNILLIFKNKLLFFLDIPCFLSSVFDENEDGYVVSYFSFSKHFVDVSPYEQVFFP